MMNRASMTQCRDCPSTCHTMPISLSLKALSAIGTLISSFACRSRVRHLTTHGVTGVAQLLERLDPRRFHDRRFEPCQEQSPKNLDSFSPSQKSCADSLSLWPTPVCMRMRKNDHVRHVKDPVVHRCLGSVGYG